MTSSRAWLDSSPFHLVPCSPYIGTTVPSVSPAPRVVPDIGETADTFHGDSLNSFEGQDVPQTPVLDHLPGPPSSIQTPAWMRPHTVQRAATPGPEQEVPKTPIKTDTPAEKQASLLSKKSRIRTTPSKTDDTKEINLFHGNDEDIFA